MGIDILTLAAARAGKGGGGASKYAQPDWGAEENGVFLPEMVLTPDEDSTAYIVEPFNNMVEDGKTYTVNYNGSAYKCPCTFVDMGGQTVYVLGNGAVAGLDVPACDAPFVFVIMTPEMAAQQGVYGMIMALDGATSLSVSIVGDIVHKIPSQYYSGGMVVNVTNDKKADKTYTEIKKAISSGVFPFVLWDADGNGFPYALMLDKISPTSIDFSNVGSNKSLLFIYNGEIGSVT